MLKKLAAALVAAVCCSIVAVAPASGANLPHGFVDESVGTVSVPTALAPLPDGRIIVTQKGGYVRIIDAQGRLQDFIALSLGSSRVCNDSERGLAGVAVDPNWSVNHYVYFFWTRKRNQCNTSAFDGPVNRVSRYTQYDNGYFNPNSEFVVLDNIPQKHGIHSGGDLNFGKDGYLYVTTGDGGCHYSQQSLCGDANPASRERHTLLGKVLRVTREGNPAPGNPNVGGFRCRLGSGQPGDICAETYGRGFRNPFRFAFDPNAEGTRVFVNDVGSIHWEEIDELVPGADYGWNLREGPCATGSYTNCGTTPYRNPIHAYRHDTGCVSITGGAFVPRNLWPAPYSESYLFGDFGCGKIFRLVQTATGYTSELFADGLGPLTNLDFAPTADGGQALYYTGFAQGGEIRRIRYVGAVNRPPIASLTVQTSGTSLTATLNGSGSNDPDGDGLTYEFDPGDGSGVIQTASPSVTHTYPARGSYTASLTVRDAHGLASAPATKQVVVGDQAPTIELLEPTPIHRFSVGENLRLRVAATDPEDGALGGSSVEMFVERAHDTHRHPWRDVETGAEQLVTAPGPEDLNATRNSHLVVTVKATDSSGQATVREFTILPNVVLFILRANVPVTFQVNGLTVKQDTHLYSWQGHPLNVVAQYRYDLFRRFLKWRDTGGTSNVRTFITPAADATYYANYGCC